MSEREKLSAYEAQVLIGASISGCNMAPDQTFNLMAAIQHLYLLGLVDRTDGLAIATPAGSALIEAMLLASLSTEPMAQEGGDDEDEMVRDVEAYLRNNQPRGLPKAYGGCTCSCHRLPGVMHIAACCRPSDDQREPLMTREWFERKAALEGDTDPSIAASSAPAQQEGGAVVASAERIAAAYRINLDETDLRRWAGDAVKALRVLAARQSPVAPSEEVTDEMVERFKAEFAKGRGLMMPSSEFVRRCLLAALQTRSKQP